MNPLAVTDTSHYTITQNSVNLNKIQYTYAENKYLLKFDDQIYEPTSEMYPGDPKIIKVNSNQYIWNTIPLNQELDESSQLFDYQVLPSTKKLLITTQNNYYAHFNTYSVDTNNNQINMLLNIDRAPNTYEVPKVNKISLDEKYIEFSMFACWDCDGHHPETLLYSIDTGKTKRIGKIYNLEWLKNGQYKYKEYKVIKCTEDAPGECTLEPDKLPFKSGSIE
jgi:hypothetical protein